MDPISIIVLGIVQGITEWLPISSKTQDTWVYLTFLNGSRELIIPILLYLHIGTLFAAIVYFRGEIIELKMQFFKKPTDYRAHSKGKIGFLFTSLLFTGIIGVPLLLFEKIYFPTIDASLLFSVMGIGLIITGFLLLSQKGAKTRKSGQVNWKDGILTGTLQGFSVIPGISRSGTSATGLIWRGFDSESSFHLSFLLSIPTVLIAELFLYINGGLLSFPIFDGLLLALISFIVGYLTLGFILNIVRKINLAFVCFALGILVIAVGFLHAG